MLLLDEPLGALDKKLREEMQVELRQLQRKVGITFVFVTHDQEEALALSDRIAVMSEGRVNQVDSAERLYEAPNSRAVADFIGTMNFLEGRIMGKEGLLTRISAGPLGEFLAGQYSCRPARRSPWRCARRRSRCTRRGPTQPICSAGGSSPRHTWATAAIISWRSKACRSRSSSPRRMPSTAGMLCRPGGAAWLSWPPDASIVLAE